MDGGNRALNERVPVYLTMPYGLRVLVDRYGSDRGIISFSQCIIELLESHPSIAQQVAKVYNEASPTGKDSTI